MKMWDYRRISILIKKISTSKKREFDIRNKIIRLIIRNIAIKALNL